MKACFKTFCSKVENNDREFFYQSIKLAKYELTIKRAKTVYASTISNICTKIDQRFSLFVESVAYSNILLLLDTKSWPNGDFVSFGSCEINKLTEHYMALLKKNGCNVAKISSEWTRLKTYIFPVLHNSPNESDLEIWHRIFTNNEVMAECQNTMHIFFTNAIVERLFSRMNKVKTHYQDLDWIRVSVSEKKGLPSKILCLIVLSIVGGQRRKDISSHVHIIILQKSILI